MLVITRKGRKHMLLLIAKSTVIEGKQNEFIRLANALVQQSRQETGCLQYDLVQEESEPNIFYFIEKYVDAEALQVHQTSTYFQQIVPQLGQLRTQNAEVKQCNVIEYDTTK